MHHSPWLCRVWATAGAGKVTVSIQAEAKSHYTLRPGHPEGRPCRRRGGNRGHVANEITAE